jgi:hypothetical protein
VFSFFRSRVGLVLLISLVVAGYFVIREHQVHLAGRWPLILLGVFMLSHVLMHAGHGGHLHRRHAGPEEAPDENRTDTRDGHSHG